MLVGERTQALEHGRRMEMHATRALHHRLDDHAGNRAGMRRQELVERGDVLVAVRQIDDKMVRQIAREQRVHALLGVAHRHGAGGVAVIAALEGDELRAPAGRRD